MMGRGLDPNRIWRVRMSGREWWIEADDYEQCVALLEGLYLIPLGIERKGAEFMRASQL